MKTPSILTLLTIALTTIALNLQASEAALSPRAKANQFNTVSGAQTGADAVVLNTSAIARSPRARANQINTVASAQTSAVTVSKHCALGSPKQLDQAGKNSSATCCQVAATCTTPKSCCVVAGK